MPDFDSKSSGPLQYLRSIAVDPPLADTVSAPPDSNPELQAWRERNGRANRIGDLGIGEHLPDASLEAYRELYPERSGEEIVRAYDNSMGGGQRPAFGRAVRSGRMGSKQVT